MVGGRYMSAKEMEEKASLHLQTTLPAPDRDIVKVIRRI